MLLNSILTYTARRLNIYCGTRRKKELKIIVSMLFVNSIFRNFAQMRGLWPAVTLYRESTTHYNQLFKLSKL